MRRTDRLWRPGAEADIALFDEITFRLVRVRDSVYALAEESLSAARR